MRKTRRIRRSKHKRSVRKKRGGFGFTNAVTQQAIPMSNENIQSRRPIIPSPLLIPKPILSANNARVYAQLWESGEDLDTLLGALIRMELPEEQHNRLLHRLAYNLQPGILAPHLQRIYEELLWLELPAEEFQEALEAYDISEKEKDDMMDLFLWDQLVQTL